MELEEVVVTGSLIAGTPEDAALPVDVISQEDLQRQGSPTTVELLKSLSVSSGVLGDTNQFDTRAQGSEGSGSVNLRGLGAQRTLVLLNGRRMSPNPFGQAAAGIVDTNTIPAAAIGRVEVLKEGAAATYGSDAIAGVVNFITRKNFEGAEVGASYRYIDGSKGDYNASLATMAQAKDAVDAFFNDVMVMADERKAREVAQYRQEKATDESVEALIEADVRDATRRGEGRVLGVAVDSQPLRLNARVVTGALTERVAPLVELAYPDSTVWARLAQLGQKGTFAVRLNSTRFRLMTPEVRVHRAIPMTGSIPADFSGMLENAVLTVEVTVADSTHVHQRALTPGLGWALLLPFNYPLDHMGLWPSAIWLALTLLPFAFWLGRARLSTAWHVGLGVAVLALGINLSTWLFGLQSDGIPAWICCGTAFLVGRALGLAGLHHEGTKDAKAPY